jgi:hypothetical protein
MAAEEDNFDIDIYGDGDGEGYAEEDAQAETAVTTEHRTESHTGQGTDAGAAAPTGTYDHPAHLPPKPQGIKRDRGDDRLTDPGATAALFISDVPWWITDDEMRGWAHQSGCEEELEEITFSEHKVNGKSKG